MKKMVRAIKLASPAIMNRPQKLARLKLFEDIEVVELRQIISSKKYLFSISIILGPSVTFRIALETSGTRGEPRGKTCEETKNYANVRIML